MQFASTVLNCTYIRIRNVDIISSSFVFLCIVSRLLLLSSSPLSSFSPFTYAYVCCVGRHYCERVPTLMSLLAAGKTLFFLYFNYKTSILFTFLSLSFCLYLFFFRKGIVDQHGDPVGVPVQNTCPFQNSLQSTSLFSARSIGPALVFGHHRAAESSSR